MNKLKELDVVILKSDHEKVKKGTKGTIVHVFDTLKDVYEVEFIPVGLSQEAIYQSIGPVLNIAAVGEDINIFLCIGCDGQDRRDWINIRCDRQQLTLLKNSVKHRLKGTLPTIRLLPSIQTLFANRPGS